MSETITLADDFNPFDDTIVAQPPVEAPVETTDPIDPPQETPPAPTTTETQFDYNSFVKENFGYDSVDAAKEEIQKLKSKPEISFDNEVSERLFNLIKEGKKDKFFTKRRYYAERFGYC